MSKPSVPIQVQVDWEKDLCFSLSNLKGFTTMLDSEQRAGLSPMESLLGALAGCMAIDVVLILRKMRQNLSRLSTTVTGERRPEPPRHFQSIHLKFQASGKLEREKLERAIALSFEKYCSVFHTLRPDLTVTHEVELHHLNGSS